MSFAKTIISGFIALACVAAPASALARADGWYTFDKNGAPAPLPNGTMPLEHVFTTSDDTIHACFSKGDDWSKCGNYRDPKAYQAEREVKVAADAAAPPAGKFCSYTPNPVRYAPPGQSPNDPCNPTQVDKRYMLAPNAICNHTVNGAQMCAWVLVGGAQAVGQQYVQQPVLRCPMGYDRLPNGDCYLGSAGFLWVYPGRAIYIGYGYSGYGYSSYYSYYTPHHWSGNLRSDGWYKRCRRHDTCTTQ